jgi:hypothetical protein
VPTTITVLPNELTVNEALPRGTVTPDSIGLGVYTVPLVAGSPSRGCTVRVNPVSYAAGNDSKFENTNSPVSVTFEVKTGAKSVYFAGCTGAPVFNY